MMTELQKIVLRFFTLSILFISNNNQIQAGGLPSKGGLTLFMGPSAYYFMGESSDNLNSFDCKLLNVQLNAIVGYSSSHSGGGNSICVFATGGYANKATFDQLTLIQGNTPDGLLRKDFNSFYQIEAGMLIRDALRLSTGVGRQHFSLGSEAGHFDYFSSTAGFQINFGNVYWNIDANFNYGDDFSKTVIKISTGIMCRF